MQAPNPQIPHFVQGEFFPGSAAAAVWPVTHPPSSFVGKVFQVHEIDVGAILDQGHTGDEGQRVEEQTSLHRHWEPLQGCCHPGHAVLSVHLQVFGKAEGAPLNLRHDLESLGGHVGHLQDGLVPVADLHPVLEVPPDPSGTQEVCKLG